MKKRQTFSETFFLFTLFLSIQFSVFGQTPKQQKLELTRLQLEKKFSSVGEFDTTSLIATYSINGKYGYIDTTGRELKIKLSEKIYSLFSFINGYALIGTIVDNNKKLYIIDKNGTVLQKLNNIDDVREWNNIDRIIAKDISGRHGVINRKGKIVIPFKYYLLESIEGNYLRAYVGEKFNLKVGLIDFKDSVIVPPTNDQLYYFNKSANYLLICNGKDLIAINKGKKYIAKNAFTKNYPEPSRLHVDFSNGLILNKTQDTDILYDLKLDTIKVITQRFDNIDFISNGFIGVRNWLNKEFDSTGRFTKATGSEFSLLTKDGKTVKPMFLGDASEFIEGMSRTKEVKNNYGYSGFMNKDCIIVIPCIYNRSTDFKNGFAKVQKGDKYFLIDKGGNFVMDIKPF